MGCLLAGVGATSRRKLGCAFKSHALSNSKFLRSRSPSHNSELPESGQPPRELCQGSLSPWANLQAGSLQSPRANARQMALWWQSQGVSRIQSQSCKRLLSQGSVLVKSGGARNSLAEWAKRHKSSLQEPERKHPKDLEPHPKLLKSL